VLFIKDGKLLFLKGIKLKAIADRKRISLRCAPTGPAHRHPGRAASGRGIRLWKQHVLGDKPADPAHRTSDSPALDAGLFFLCAHQSGLGQMPISN
jgi:hypothetical protein